jgi:hypothetical protein
LYIHNNNRNHRTYIKIANSYKKQKRTYITRSKTAASSRQRRLIAIKDLSHCEIFLSSNSKISAGENLRRMSSGRNKGCNEAEDGVAVTSGVAAVIVDEILLGIGEEFAVGGDEEIVRSTSSTSSSLISKSIVVQ